MANRLRAKQGLTYPAPASQALVEKAGGLSKLTPTERAKVKLRRVEAGEWCDDLPEPSKAHLIEQNLVEVVEAEIPAPTRRRTKRGGK